MNFDPTSQIHNISTNNPRCKVNMKTIKLLGENFREIPYP